MRTVEGHVDEAPGTSGSGADRHRYALWDSLTAAEREAEFDLTAEQRAELDRRLAEHIADPTSAIPWDEVRRTLLRGA
jgi:putative addiction module component (TIGR02574 family)